MNLNLGCGKDYIEGWINVDNRQYVKADLYCDIRNVGGWIDEGTIDQIQATSILEHISWKDIPALLHTSYKILKPGGNLLIKGPDIQRVAEKYVRGEIREQLFLEVVYGTQDYEENSHKSGWSETGLKEQLLDAGFKEVGVTWRDDSWGFEIGAKK